MFWLFKHKFKWFFFEKFEISYVGRNLVYLLPIIHSGTNQIKDPCFFLLLMTKKPVIQGACLFYFQDVFPNIWVVLGCLAGNTLFQNQLICQFCYKDIWSGQKCFNKTPIIQWCLRKRKSFWVTGREPCCFGRKRRSRGKWGRKLDKATPTKADRRKPVQSIKNK